MRPVREPHMIRMNPKEWAEILAAAEAAGLSASEVMRNGGLKEARRILRSK